jgi:phosphatidylserine/phosphatidylglycerophosphate/cardiolipin synthase-like enzyme
VVRVVCLLLPLLLLVGCSNPANFSPLIERSGAAGVGQDRLWQDASIFTLVADLIAQSRHRVMVEMYELGRDEIVNSLAQAKGRGVAVRVLTDPTVTASRASGARLDALGVSERVYPVDDGRHQIDHVKLLIADDQAAIGGMNWGRHSERNHDYVLQTRLADHVARLTAIFEQDWALAGGHPQPLPAVTGDVGQTAPTSEIRAMLDGALAGAKRRILAEIYTLTDPDVIAMLAIAHRRGLDVRVILDPNQEYNLHAFALLRAASVPVRWYPVPRGILLHAKIGLFDGELVLGSANWTLSGLGVNHELDIKTRDPYALADYGSRFESDWSKSAS